MKHYDVLLVYYITHHSNIIQNTLWCTVSHYLRTQRQQYENQYMFYLPL